MRKRLIMYGWENEQWLLLLYLDQSLEANVKHGMTFNQFNILQTNQPTPDYKDKPWLLYPVTGIIETNMIISIDELVLKEKKIYMSGLMSVRANVWHIYIYMRGQVVKS